MGVVKVRLSANAGIEPELLNCFQISSFGFFVSRERGDKSPYLGRLMQSRAQENISRS